MAPSRAKTACVLLKVPSALLFLTTLLAPFVFASSEALSQPNPKASPPADVDLICHTDDPADCYPKIFQPTEEFQTIRDDQDIPPGLHVRLNIYTGVKEARLNIQTEGDDDASGALGEGVPIQRGVIVVEPENGHVDENPDGVHAGSSKTAGIPLGAPGYDPIGNPKPPAGGAEVQFTEALDLFRMLGYKPDEEGDKAHTVDGALDELRELSHDAYYGMLIAADKEVIKGLFCLMLPEKGPQETQNHRQEQRSQAAAYVLAGALSNNHNAVKELVAGWDALMQTTCNGEDSARLVSLLYSDFVPSPSSLSSASSAKARIAALDGMLESPRIRAQFLSNGGMRSLLAVLSAAQAEGGREWEAAARRAGQLVLDRFLDEEMGASLGQWPRVEMLGEDGCREQQQNLREEGCWRYVVGEAMKGGAGDWSRELWERLGNYVVEQKGDDQRTEL